MRKDISTAAVIGGGIIGSWAALHLAEAGVNTTLFEQFPLPHTRGSSHGQSRAFRFLGELELGRLDYSWKRWMELERITGESMFVKTGLLNFGPPGDPDLDKYMQVLHENDRSYEWLDSKAIASRYPMIRYPKEWGAAWDPDGGILIAYRCLNAVQNRFVNLGGRIKTGRVVGLETSDETHVRLQVSNGITVDTKEHSFDRVIICAGPWTARVVQQFQPLLNPILTPVTYWHDPKGIYSTKNGFPIIFNARLMGVYGLPACEYENQVKFLFHGGPECDPDLRDQSDMYPYVEKVRNYVREHLPDLDSNKPSILETCMYTMTPDNFPIIDRLSTNLIVGCGFSGSGFKHSPATGYMLALLALGLEDQLPEDFGAERYLVNRFET